MTAKAHARTGAVQRPGEQCIQTRAGRRSPGETHRCKGCDCIKKSKSEGVRNCLKQFRETFTDTQKIKQIKKMRPFLSPRKIKICTRKEAWS